MRGPTFLKGFRTEVDHAQVKLTADMVLFAIQHHEKSTEQSLDGIRNFFSGLPLKT
jgi:hypothetical protein